jgi:hypothetical protein
MYVLIGIQLAACKEVGLYVTVWGKPQKRWLSMIRLGLIHAFETLCRDNMEGRELLLKGVYRILKNCLNKMLSTHSSSKSMSKI